MKRALTAICLALGLTGLTAGAATLTPEQKREELQALATLIKAQYGPYEYKGTLLKVSLDELVDRYGRLAASASNLEFYYLLNRFVAEFQDSHFGARLNTNHVSKLGFLCDRVQGKALIDEIDRSVLPEADFPFERGDEIVAIGGRPADQVIRELAAHLGTGYRETGLRAATVLLGYRAAAQVPAQYGKVDVSIRRGTSAVIDTVTLEWQQEGDEVLEDNPPAWDNGPTHLGYGDLRLRTFDGVLPQTEKSFRCSGTTRTFVPKDATVLIEKPFVAYYHPTPKGNVGYLRIPHYYWQNEYDLRFKQYEWAIHNLEKNTVGLVIDQDHNCGGSVDYLERMVSLFARAPFKALEFQFLATRNEYLQFKSWLNDDGKFTLEGAALTEVLDLIKTSWLKGERMTPKTTFSGSRLREPNGIRYTKPVVMLVDEMSGSGGDAFPAMLQGLGRAKLLGKRTMGAGGHVVEVSPLYYSANTVRLTKSLFYHPNGTAIENHGVTPDVAYEPTRDDFLYGYRDYQKKYLEVLLGMIP